MPVFSDPRISRIHSYSLLGILAILVTSWRLGRNSATGIDIGLNT